MLTVEISFSAMAALVRFCLALHSADIGLIGLAVMGQNLILNMNGTYPNEKPCLIVALARIDEVLF